MRYFCIVPAAVASVALLTAFSFLPTSSGAKATDAPPASRTADPWDAATRDPTLARVYQAVAEKLLPSTLPDAQKVASDKHVAVRLLSLRDADPTNAFPIYLLAFITVRNGDLRTVTRLLQEGNTAPRLVYPISADVLTRAYPGGIVLRNLAAIATARATREELSDRETTALLTELRTMGNRLARGGEPRTPILFAVGAAIRLTAEKGLADAHDRAGRAAEATMLRAASAAFRTWNEKATREYQSELGPGGPQGPEVFARPRGITAEDLRNHLNGIPLTGAAQRNFPAFNRELARSERRMADRTLKDMPD